MSRPGAVTARTTVILMTKGHVQSNAEHVDTEETDPLLQPDLQRGYDRS